MVKISESAIKEAAYYNWQNAGCPQGKDEYFWEMAVEQLSKSSSSCKSSSSSCGCKTKKSSTATSSSSTVKTTSTARKRTTAAKK